jgi:outer membrane protein
MTNTIELLTLQNNKFAADANLASAKYDLIFRLKVIDYYLGKALKL